jgi:hypothetical protein
MRVVKIELIEKVSEDIEVIDSYDDIKIGNYIKICSISDTKCFLSDKKYIFAKIIYKRDKDFIMIGIDNDRVYSYKYSELPIIKDEDKDRFIYLIPSNENEIMVNNI